jgi:hypothetical protein
MKTITSLVAVGLLFLAVAATSVVAFPRMISYQGRLLNSEGNPVDDGDYEMTFSIYDSENDGTLMWTSGIQTVPVLDGLFTYELGSSVTLPDDLFELGSTRYLSINVEGEDITPRAHLISSPYAFEALSSLRSDTGYIALDVDGYECINTFEIENGTILTEDIGSNGATPDQILKWNGVAWMPADDETGVASGWIDDGGVVKLETDTDNVGIGTASPNEKLDVQGNVHASGSISSGNSITIDGASDQITATSGTLDFDDEILTTTGGASITAPYQGLIVNSDGISTNWTYPPSESFVLRVQRGYTVDDPDSRYGVYGSIWNTGDGTVYGTYGGASSYIEEDGGTVYGVYGRGQSDATRYGVYGYSTSFASSPSTFGISYGVHGRGNSGSSAFGVYGIAQNATTGYGIYGAAVSNTTNWAGYFSGNCRVTGTFDNSKSLFVIDHPDDPANQYLSHSYVASPDMMNIYNGNVVTDNSGKAVVELPEYFDSLNRDFRYQLTVIGTFAQAIVQREISGNEFTIATSEPNVKVSWQVTGIRKDAYAKANPAVTEIDKRSGQQGKYLHPEVFGLDESMSIDYERNLIHSEDIQIER